MVFIINKIKINPSPPKEGVKVDLGTKIRVLSVSANRGGVFLMRLRKIAVALVTGCARRCFHPSVAASLSLAP